MEGQPVMKHDSQLIGTPVHFFNAEWQDGLPRAGFIDGFAADAGMFSITVERSQADQRKGAPPRNFFPRVLLVQNVTHKPIGVDIVAVIRSGNLINTNDLSVGTHEFAGTIVNGQIRQPDASRPPVPARSALPEYSEDPEDATGEAAAPEPEPKPKPKPKPKREPAAKKPPAPPAPPAPRPAPPAPSPSRPGPVVHRMPEPLPPGFGPEDATPPPLDASGPRIVYDADDEAGGDDGDGVLGVGSMVGDEDTSRPAPPETRSAVDQLMANPTWSIARDLTRDDEVRVERTGLKEVSFFLPGEDRPVARLLWMSIKPCRPDQQPEPHGFAFKLRDKGGRTSFTLAEHCRRADEIQPAFSKMARAIRAAKKAKPGDWGSSAANMLAVINNKT